MRRLLSILLVVFLPLQWSAAAAAVGCAHVLDGHRHETSTLFSHGHGSADAPAHASHHAVARTDSQSSPHDPTGMTAVASEDRAVAPDGHAHPSAHHHDHEHADTSAADGASVASLADDCGHADCGGCCHAVGSMVGSTSLRSAGAPAGSHALAVGADRSAPSPALDGPFKPPRLAPA